MNTRLDILVGPPDRDYTLFRGNSMIQAVQQTALTGSATDCDSKQDHSVTITVSPSDHDSRHYCQFKNKGMFTIPLSHTHNHTTPKHQSHRNYYFKTIIEKH